MRAKLLFLAFLFCAGTALAAERSEMLDANKDGRKETRMFYDGKDPVRAEMDRDGDGRFERRVQYKNGKRFTAENDQDGDGRIERWDFYSRKGRIGRTSKDSNKDGKPDSFTTFLQGQQLVMKEQDRNGDGNVDRRRFCQWALIKRPGAPETFGYQPIWSEEDSDFDGKIDKSVNKTDKPAALAKLGTPMDGSLTPYPDTPDAPKEAKKAPETPAGGGGEGADEKAGPHRGPERRLIDRMNERFGLEAVDWENIEKENAYEDD